MKPEAQKQRIEYFDYLRVFATLSVPAIVLLTAAVSFAISGILNRIPQLGKYIV